MEDNELEEELLQLMGPALTKTTSEMAPRPRGPSPSNNTTPMSSTSDVSKSLSGDIAGGGTGGGAKDDRHLFVIITRVFAVFGMFLIVFVLLLVVFVSLQAHVECVDDVGRHIFLCFTPFFTGRSHHVKDENSRAG